MTPWVAMAAFSLFCDATGNDFPVSFEAELERSSSGGTDLGGLDEETTLSNEVEVLVSLLAVMAMMRQFKCTRVRWSSRWTGHEERCGRSSGSLVDSRVAFEVG